MEPYDGVGMRGGDHADEGGDYGGGGYGGDVEMGGGGGEGPAITAGQYNAARRQTYKPGLCRRVSGWTLFFTALVVAILVVTIMVFQGKFDNMHKLMGFAFIPGLLMAYSLYSMAARCSRGAQTARNQLLGSEVMEDLERARRELPVYIRLHAVAYHMVTHTSNGKRRRSRRVTNRATAYIRPDSNVDISSIPDLNALGRTMVTVRNGFELADQSSRDNLSVFRDQFAAENDTDRRFTLSISLAIPCLTTVAGNSNTLLVPHAFLSNGGSNSCLFSHLAAKVFICFMCGWCWVNAMEWSSSTAEIYLSKRVAFSSVPSAVPEHEVETEFSAISRKLFGH